mmetsp:Transcript_97756/g.271984  ORF Transcript_97756/g.271984 Transcript_97756/m.271984 type:complete len:298 (+) Transcript_97756:2-895(+)
MARFVPGSRSMKTQVGSPGYTAPEVFAGLYDEKCDIFSCGVMLYCMVCGRMPFKDDAQARGTSVAFASDDEDLSADVVALLRQCLNRDPLVRLSAPEVLESAWLRTPSTQGLMRSSMPAEDVFESLRSFTHLTDLEKRSLYHVAYNVEDAEVTEIREAFKRMDVDSDGVLTFEDLLANGREVSGSIANEAVVQHVGFSQSAGMEYTEFLAAMLHLRLDLPEMACRAAFRALDGDDDGSVSVHDIVKTSSPSSEDGRAASTAVDDEESVLSVESALSFEDFRALLAPKCKTMDGRPAC